MKKTLALVIAGLMAQAHGKAWLYQQIPENSHAYLKLPSHWQLLLLENSKDSKELGEQFAKIRQGLSELQGVDLPESVQKLLRSFFQQNGGPLEIAFIDNKDHKKEDRVNIGLQLNHHDKDKFFQLIKEFAVSIHAEVKGDASAGELIEKAGPKTCYSFDDKSGQVLLAVGCQPAGKAPEALVQQLESQAPGDDEALLWISNANNRIFKSKHGKDSPLLSQVDWLSLSYNKEQQLKFKLNNFPLAVLFPAATLPADFPVSANLHQLFSISVPGAQELAQLEPQLPKMLDEQLKPLDLSADEVLAALAGPWTYIDDQNGTFLVRQKDKNAALDQLLEKMVAKKWLSKDVQGGVTHLKVESKLSGSQRLALNMFVPNHIYYVDAGDYRLFADLPQVLADQQNLEKTKKISDFLPAQLQKSPLAFASQQPDLARQSYYSRLRWLRLWGDLSGQKVDLTALPPASKLQLASASTISLGLQPEEKALSLELNLPNGLTDLTVQLSNYNAFSIGLLSAIVLPAYNQYVERAKREQELLKK